MVHLGMGKLQIAIRHWLGLASPEEVSQVIEFLFEKPTKELADFLDNVKDRSAVLKALEVRVDTKLSALNAMELRIADRFRELTKSEKQMEHLAGDMTLAIYDAVEKIMAEIDVAKRTVEKEKENQSDE